MVTASRGGTLAEQFVLHAEAGQPVAEVADRLVVVEVGLSHPPLRTLPRTTKPPGWVASGSTVNPLLSCGIGRITGRRATCGGWAARNISTSSHNAKVRVP